MGGGACRCRRWMAPHRLGAALPATAPGAAVAACPACRAHGFVFDQAAFIAAHRRKSKVAAFLLQFRNSQVGWGLGRRRRCRRRPVEHLGRPGVLLACRRLHGACADRPLP